MLYYQHFAFALSFLSGFKAATQWGVKQEEEGGREAWSGACDGKEESEAIRLNWFTVEQRKHIYLF